MRYLVPGDIVVGKGSAVGHDAAVPEGVRTDGAEIVNVRLQGETLVVYAIAAKTIPIEVVGVTGVSVSVIAIGFVGRGIAFKTAADGKAVVRLLEHVVVL